MIPSQDNIQLVVLLGNKHVSISPHLGHYGLPLSHLLLPGYLQTGGLDSMLTPCLRHISFTLTQPPRSSPTTKERGALMAFELVTGSLVFGEVTIKSAKSFTFQIWERETGSQHGGPLNWQQEGTQLTEWTMLWGLLSWKERVIRPSLSTFADSQVTAATLGNFTKCL
jgi:hypothetical protein